MNLFIDDERFPYQVTWADWYGNIQDFFITRNWKETWELIDTYGFPNFISFDHDLGDPSKEYTGYEISKKMVNNLMDGVWELPKDFSFSVHSKNPIGKSNIEKYWENYLKGL